MSVQLYVSSYACTCLKHLDFAFHPLKCGNKCESEMHHAFCIFASICIGCIDVNKILLQLLLYFIFQK